MNIHTAAQYNLLIVEDEQGIRHGLNGFFTRQGYEVYEAAGFEQALVVPSITSLKSTVSGIAAKYEKQIIEHFLSENNYNKSRTPSALSLTRKTLDEKIHKYNLKLP